VTESLLVGIMMVFAGKHERLGRNNSGRKLDDVGAMHSY